MTEKANVKKDKECITVIGAKEHNLKNIDCTIPKNKLVVVTGLSGCGKSSLAFDTVYSEGQRRYMELFSSYMRNYLGGLQRPDVDKIDGLSPVISIQQKTTNRNPHSTVGTITEVLDFLRLLFARAATAYSYITGKTMQLMHDEKILKHIRDNYHHKTIAILAPVVKARKGHYRELFKQIAKQGYTKVRVDGEMLDIEEKMQLERYKIHDIEIVVDRLAVQTKQIARLRNSLLKALKIGKGYVKILAKEEGERNYSRFLTCMDSGISYEEPQPNSFSFNSPYGWCPTCSGLGYKNEINPDAFIKNEHISIKDGALIFFNDDNSFTSNIMRCIFEALKIDIHIPLKKIEPTLLKKIFFPKEEIIVYPTQFGSENKKKFKYKGIEDLLSMLVDYRSKKKNNGEDTMLEKYYTEVECETCRGSRLKKESLHFKINKKNIHELSSMSLSKLQDWFKNAEEYLDEKQKTIAKDLLKEINERVHFLNDIGLGYLTLNRKAGSLSGGEMQRIRLATQIGSKLMNILYILDEPSIGLHQRDNRRLIDALKKLRDFNNTILVVEHDREIIEDADYLIDIGPKAGLHGGEIVYEGEVGKITTIKDSLTGKYLSREKDIGLPKRRPIQLGSKKNIKIYGAKGNNLKHIDLSIPLQKFICITGVSGSGKSSLITETLYPILKKHLYNTPIHSLPYDNIEGLENIDKVIEIDQSPIGRTPRSNPATYINVFTDIRKIFSMIPEAKIRGYSIGRFSFNVKGGRCEHCQGGGAEVLKMNFLPDVNVTCPVCLGKRYNRQTLEIKYKGKSINDVLEMNIEDASDFFKSVPFIYRKIKTLNDVGLGYIKLGQSSTTLSGGEAQRVKLAKELSKRDTGKSFYILDEPTTGLHFEDIKHLIEILQKLVDKGNTVLVIEHNLDIVKVADYIIDLGPEGGEQGGQIVFEGSPEQLIKNNHSYTAKFLKEEIQNTVKGKTSI